MRSAFIEPEKFLINQVDVALSKLETYQNIFAKNPKAKTEMHQALIDARIALHAAKEKYKNFNSMKYTVDLTCLWNKVTKNTDLYSQKVVEIQAAILRITSKIKPMSTRQDTLGEFIAEISTDKDGGAAHREAFQKVAVSAALNAGDKIFEEAIQDSGLVGDLMSEENRDARVKRAAEWVGENRHRVSECVQDAARNEIETLAKRKDPSILKMHQNQAIAISDCQELFNGFHENINSIKELEDATVLFWENFDELMSSPNQEKKCEQLDQLVEIITRLIQKFKNAQEKAKLPLNNFGFDDVIHEIQYGQEALLDQFQKKQHLFRKICIKNNELANASPPSSPVSSTRSSASLRGSFFSDTSSRSSSDTSSASSSRSSSPSSSSNSGSDEPIRKHARIF
ncbi:MAG: hypothetical protein NTU49_01770 [Gammaproteobacteria bacterium]|nr:hypothetical protein [Gammaproteobacteria bacterium]